MESACARRASVLVLCSPVLKWGAARIIESRQPVHLQIQTLAVLVAERDARHREAIAVNINRGEAVHGSDIIAFGRKIPLGDAGGVILAKAKKFLRRFQLTTVSPD
jgi:hypothetical protein